MEEQTWAKHCDDACAAARDGDYGQSEYRWRLAWSLALKLFEENDPRYLMTLEYLSDMLCLQKKLQDAEPLLVNLLSLKMKVMEPTSLQVGATHNTLAGLYYSLKRHDEAEEHCLKSLEIHEKILGDQNSDVVMILYNLALIYHAKRSYEQADAAYRRALDAAKAVYGDSHPETANIADHYAALLNVTGKKEEAQNTRKTMVLPVYERLMRAAGVDDQVAKPQTNKGFPAATLTGMERDPRRSNQCMYRIKPLPTKEAEVEPETNSKTS